MSEEKLRKVSKNVAQIAEGISRTTSKFRGARLAIRQGLLSGFEQGINERFENLNRITATLRKKRADASGGGGILPQVRPQTGNPTPPPPEPNVVTTVGERSRLQTGGLLDRIFGPREPSEEEIQKEKLARKIEEEKRKAEEERKKAEADEEERQRKINHSHGEAPEAGIFLSV